MADWLSAYRGIEFFSGRNSSVSNFRIQSDSLTASHIAIYSASAVDRATNDCFLAAQLIAPPAILNTYPPIDFQSISSDANPESVKPLSPCLFCPHVRLRFRVPFRYRSIRLAVSQ